MNICKYVKSTLHFEIVKFSYISLTQNARFSILRFYLLCTKNTGLLRKVTITQYHLQLWVSKLTLPLPLLH